MRGRLVDAPGSSALVNGSIRSWSGEARRAGCACGGAAPPGMILAETPGCTPSAISGFRGHRGRRSAAAGRAGMPCELNHIFLHQGCIVFDVSVRSRGVSFWLFCKCGKQRSCGVLSRKCAIQKSYKQPDSSYSRRTARTGRALLRALCRRRRIRPQIGGGREATRPRRDADGVEGRKGPLSAEGVRWRQADM